MDFSKIRKKKYKNTKEKHRKNTKDKIKKNTKEAIRKKKDHPKEKKDKGIPKKAGGTGPAKLPKSRHFAVKDYGKFLFPKGRRRPSFFICPVLR